MPSGTKPVPGVLSQEVAAILRAQMARKRVSQGELATAVNSAQSQVSGILNARKHVDIEKLDELCQALGLEFAEVIRSADRATEARYLAEGRPRTIVDP